MLDKMHLALSWYSALIHVYYILLLHAPGRKGRAASKLHLHEVPIGNSSSCCVPELQVYLAQLFGFGFAECVKWKFLC